MNPIAPCLWFDGNAEDAVNFYTGLLPNSQIDRIVRSPMDNPGSGDGAVMLVEFTLNGQAFIGLNGGPGHPFTEAVSLTITTETQDESDNVWNALTSDGGEPMPCGWCKDKFGLRWQVYPKRMIDLLADKDRDRAARAFQSMMTMTRIDVSAVEKAALVG
jgi:predicted 3-demethylubiquinone-9 3-methyltransferase (glyoxalase superfamily)